MTEKDIAKELIDKYVNQDINFIYSDSQDGVCIGDGNMTFKSAKKCAIIALDREYNARLSVIKQLADYMEEDVIQQITIFTKRAWGKIKEEIIRL